MKHSYLLRSRLYCQITKEHGSLNTLYSFRKQLNPEFMNYLDDLADEVQTDQDIDEVMSEIDLYYKDNVVLDMGDDEVFNYAGKGEPLMKCNVISK